jgi:LPS sulfotransferase NodH
MVLYILDRIGTSKRGKVGARCKAHNVLFGWKLVREIGAIGRDDAVIRHKGRDTVVVAENLARNLFAHPGRAHIVLERIFARLAKI